MDAKTKLSKARTQLLLDKRYVFWATIGLYQEPVEVAASWVGWAGREPTMATDGDHLYYNPEFVEKLTNTELMFVLAHEAGHCALGHHLRRQQRDALAWNIACDYALNQMLVDYNCNLKPPKGVLLNDKYKGMSAEEIYGKFKFIDIPPGWNIGGVLDAVAKKDGQGLGDPNGCEIIVRQAAAVAKAQGHLPGAFEDYVQPVKPKIDLYSLLRHLFSTAQNDDYTWRRPDKKHVWQELYLPSTFTESMGDILVGVDTSGSVDDKQLARFIGVVNVVLSDLRPRRVFLVQCDAQIQKWDEFGPGECLPDRFKIKGRGGTSMRPIWEWAKGRNFTCAVVCSDFYMSESDFGDQQAFPVAWVTMTRDVKAPWGTTVRMDD